jgi:hypothetical protein
MALGGTIAAFDARYRMAKRSRERKSVAPAAANTAGTTG